MDLANMFKGNWQTTVIGFGLAFLNQLATNGAKFPSTKQEWINTAVSAALAALGIAAKDANVGSKAK